MESTIFSILMLVATAFSYDLMLGYPDAGSKLVYSKVHQENPAIWVRSESFTVNCTQGEVINALSIMDLRQDKAGEVYLKGGGIGQNFITIELDSPSVFRGYNFWVDVYAIQTNNFIMNHGKK